jgi:hypothetical protein
MATNTTNTTTALTTANVKRLEQKAKAGWKCFFMMRDDYCELNEHYGNLLQRNRAMVQILKANPSADIDITFLKTQFIEMYDMIKKNSECPVCFETITKENIEVPSCGHLICKGCKENVMKNDKKCPCCRKVFYGNV